MSEKITFENGWVNVFEEMAGQNKKRKGVFQMFVAEPIGFGKKVKNDVDLLKDLISKGKK